MAFLGIDFDTHAVYTGVIESDYKVSVMEFMIPRAGRFPWDLRGWGNLRRIYGDLRYIDRVVIERPMNQAFGAKEMMIRVEGAIITHLPDRPYELLEISAPTWKKIVLGNGHASKDDSLEYWRQRGVNLDGNHNKADALCLAKLAQMLDNPEVKALLPKTLRKERVK